MPRIDEILSRVENAKFITAFDLTKGFYKIPFRDASQESFSIVTSFGNNQFFNLPDGRIAVLHFNF